jgi:hypothetical protein
MAMLGCSIPCPNALMLLLLTLLLAPSLDSMCSILQQLLL